MKGGRNVPKTHVTTVHRVRVRERAQSSPERSADEALLNFILGRGTDGSEPLSLPDESGGDA